jgi:hypothetical protein
LRVCLLSSRRIAPSVSPARATASADWNWSSVYAACTQPAVAPMRRGPDSLLQANCKLARLIGRHTSCRSSRLITCIARR